MRIIRRITVAFFIIVLIAWGFYAFYMRPRHTVPVLMYHSITEDTQSSLSVSPENFKKQIAYLERSGYSVISLDELLPAAQRYGHHHLSIYGLVAGMAVMALSLIMFL